MHKAINVDPYAILGIRHDTTTEQIHQAYEQKMEAGQASEQLDAAYALIASDRARFRYQLLSPAPLEDIHTLPSAVKTNPKYLGPGAWLKVIRKNTG